MEDKKKKIKFLNDVSEKFKALEPEKKKLITIISIIVIILIIVTIITSIIFAVGTNNAGKVIGNINNGSFAVKNGGKVILTNTAINSGNDLEKGIYEIDLNNNDETTLITQDEYVKSLIKYRGNIYYVAANQADNGNYIKQIIKMKPNGKNKQVLVDNIETTSIGNSTMNISDGWVYYLNAEYKLEKVKTNGEKRQQIADEEIETFQISGNNIYYLTRDNEFKKMKKDGSQIEEIEKGIGNFQVVNNDVYYISRSNYYLMKLDLKTKEETEIVNKKVKTFNIYKKTIYYATNETEDRAIYSTNLNGKKHKKIVDLLSANNFICIVGNWIYYTDKIEDSIYNDAVYRIKTNGKDKEMINI